MSRSCNLPADAAPSMGAGAVVRDEELARKAREGCRQSFDELARRFQVRLLRFLQRHTRSAADAEDLLQESFVRAYQNLDRYDEKRPFSTWLFTIAHRIAVSHHRRHKSAAHAAEVIADRMRGAERVEPGRQMADAEVRQIFWETAGRVLTPEQFDATWLFYVEEMPAKQIADVMGRSWVSVKTILFRARKRLAPSLRSLEESEEPQSRDVRMTAVRVSVAG
ncbi:MAG: polymerase sigma-54 factor RpoN [Phycisphaerales bacterium]|nr:polymerase sigma-54 factor RpoN [Phycisphaerales bacterium]MDB5354966.1 polymerase sigma-54 factor RpoN [Phycisphaerales bacterium]